VKEWLYKAVLTLTRRGGSWIFVVISRIIAAGYFVGSPKVKESHRFYALLYPDRGAWYHRWCSFQQYQNFTTIHLDRFLAAQQQDTTFVSHGWEKLDSVVRQKGAILLMSHLGNWEIAAHLLKKQQSSLKLLLYMGVKDQEYVEGLQKEQLHQSGVTIIGVAKDGGSPFDAVEGIRFLRDGGLVSMTGDIVWRADQRKRRVSFLGGEAFIPEAPYIFALVSGAPIFVFFPVRTGKNSYELMLSDPIYLAHGDRAARETIIQAAAQHYADLLEQQLRAHPYEWYHFDRFIE